jgi:hypothetical protein
MAASSSSASGKTVPLDIISRRLEWILPFVNPNIAHDDIGDKDTDECKLSHVLLNVNRTGKVDGKTAHTNNIFVNENDRTTSRVDQIPFCNATLQLLIQLYCTFVFCPTDNVQEHINYLSREDQFNFIMTFMTEFVNTTDTLGETEINSRGMSYMHAFLYVAMKLSIGKFNTDTSIPSGILYKEDENETIQVFTYTDEEKTLQLSKIQLLQKCIDVDYKNMKEVYVKFQIDDLPTNEDKKGKKWFENDTEMYTKMYEQSKTTNDLTSTEGQSVIPFLNLNKHKEDSTSRPTNNRCDELFQKLTTVKTDTKDKTVTIHLTGLSVTYVFNEPEMKPRSAFLAQAFFYVYRFLIVSIKNRIDLFVTNIKNMTYPTKAETSRTQMRNYHHSLYSISEYITSPLIPHSNKDPFIIQNALNIILPMLYIDIVEQIYLPSLIDLTTSDAEVIKKEDEKNKIAKNIQSLEDTLKNVTNESKKKEILERIKNETAKKDKYNEEFLAAVNIFKEKKKNTSIKQERKYARLVHNIYKQRFPSYFSNPIDMFYCSARILCDQYISTEIPPNQFFCFVEDWVAENNRKYDLRIGHMLSTLNEFSDPLKPTFSGPLHVNMSMLNLSLEEVNRDHQSELDKLNKKANKTEADILEIDSLKQKIKENREYFESFAPNTHVGSDQSHFNFYKVRGNNIEYYTIHDTQRFYTETTSLGKISNDAYKYVKKPEKGEVPTDLALYTKSEYLKPDIPFQVSDTFDVNKTNDKTRLLKTVKFDAVYNIDDSKYETQMQVAINTMMVETIIRLFTGIVFFTYGGSGTGKTSLLFGNKGKNREGFINILLHNIPVTHPVQKKTQTHHTSPPHGKIDVFVYEISPFEEDGEIQEDTIQYYYNASGNTSFESFSSNTKLEMSPDKRHNCKFNGCKKQGLFSKDTFATDFYCEDHKIHGNLLDGIHTDRIKRVAIENCPIGSTKIMCEAIQNIDKKITVMRTTGIDGHTNQTIKKTINNPVSSRSIIVYEIVVKYEINDNDVVTIPIVVCDLPGYEHESIAGDESKWINNKIRMSLECIKNAESSTSIDVLASLKINTKVGQRYKPPRVFGLNILNRRGSHPGKLDCLYGSVLKWYPKPEKEKEGCERHKLFVRKVFKKNCLEEDFKNACILPKTDAEIEAYKKSNYNKIDTEKEPKTTVEIAAYKSINNNKTHLEKVVESHKEVRKRICRRSTFATPTEKNITDCTDYENNFQYTTWAEFMRLKSRALRKYFELQQDQRHMLDQILETRELVSKI